MYAHTLTKQLILNMASMAGLETGTFNSRSSYDDHAAQFSDTKLVQCFKMRFNLNAQIK
jgi:hypothetical protein